MLNTENQFKQPEVTDDLLKEITRKIVDHFEVEKVIVFGSHAWGVPGPESDLDLFIVMESDLSRARRAARIALECQPRLLAMDIIVQTPKELGERIEMGDPFVKRIIAEGKVLYAR